MSENSLENFGFREGINEVIGITTGASDAGNVNSAPLGIVVRKEGKAIRTFVRLFGETHTLKNLRANSKLYANVCYSPLAFAISAFEDLESEYFLNDFTLKDSYSVCVFEPVSFEKRENFTICELKFVEGFIVNPKAVRAFNRGFCAVVEAAIIATRYTGSEKEMERLKELGRIVSRCGGKEEKLAYEYIMSAINEINKM